MKIPFFKSVSTEPQHPINKAGMGEELGVSGVRISSGYVYEEFLPELVGEKGRRVFREMADNDATIGALLYATESLLKSVTWRVEASEKDTSGEYSDFVESLKDDMEHTWSDFISECLTMLPFGFSLFEKVFKRRIGPNEGDPSRKSKFTDGRIGIRKLAPRAQETLHRWLVDESSGEILGFEQLPPYGGQLITIPLDKMILFRTTSRKNNPEGRSMLRNAYTSYYFKKKIQFIEASGIERELNGIPLIRVPSAILTDSDKATIRDEYIRLARDVKFNEQGGILVPSDLWKNDDGKLSSTYKVSVELLSSSGTRSIDTDKIISRYDRNILMSTLAEFLMLGVDKGSFALSKNKSDLFLKSMEGILNSIGETFNGSVLEQVWRLNGFDHELMPKLMPGDVAPTDLEEFGNYIRNIAQAGFTLAGDEETEKVVRGAGGLPENVISELPPDPLAMMQAQAALRSGMPPDENQNDKNMKD